jgi:hypothetical protein
VPGLTEGARAVVDRLEVVGCVLEGRAGEVLAHALPDRELPGPLVRAVVSGSVAPLDGSLEGRRTVGLTGTGPVVRAALECFVVVRLPRDDGALWLLTDGEVPELIDLEAAAELLTETPSLAACLQGDSPLPAALAQCRRWWVVALAEPQRLPPSRLVVQTCGSHAVVGGPASALTRHVRGLLTGRRAGVSRAWEEPRLAAARVEADLALEVAGPGEVVTADEQRSALVVRHVTKALATLPDLGDDPLARLVGYDTRRAGRLVETLRCWLSSSTAELSIHSNTLRYRLKRIEQITGIDLRTDALGRLELQLRLAAQPQLSRSTSSTAS